MGLPGLPAYEAVLAVKRYSRASFNPHLTIQAERFIWRIMRRFADTHPHQAAVLVAQEIVTRA